MNELDKIPTLPKPVDVSTAIEDVSDTLLEKFMTELNDVMRNPELMQRSRVGGGYMLHLSQILPNKHHVQVGTYLRKAGWDLLRLDRKEYGYPLDDKMELFITPSEK